MKVLGSVLFILFVTSFFALSASANGQTVTKSTLRHDYKATVSLLKELKAKFKKCSKKGIRPSDPKHWGRWSALWSRRLVALQKKLDTRYKVDFKSDLMRNGRNLVGACAGLWVLHSGYESVLDGREKKSETEKPWKWELGGKHMLKEVRDYLKKR